MLKLMLSCATVLVSLVSYSECSYCTSIESAMENPNKVIHLDLKAQGLEDLPEELSEFVNLISLDLSDNYLMDLDFSELSLPALESIDFENNPGLNMLEIEGIGAAFPELKKINLDNCSLIFLSPELGSISTLEELSLADNTIKMLPSELENLQNLKTLNLSNNRIEEALWLKNLWTLENLNISENKKLDLHKVGIALLFKEKLIKLTVTPTGTYGGLPNVFSTIKVNEVVFADGLILNMNRRLIKNENIKQITFENVEIPDPTKVYSWIDQFETLIRVDFTDIAMSSGYSKIKSVEEIRFKNCMFNDENEINKVSSEVEVTLIGNYKDVGDVTVSNEESISGILDGESIVPMSDAMISNTVEPIIEAEEQVFKIDASEPQNIKLEYSSYEIPSQAFLNDDGEVYDGEVDVKIIEYVDPVLNALAGSPMIFREGNDNNLFASSGMIDFRAYGENGEELNANPDNIIQVELNNSQPSEQTDLYSFNEADSNWVNEGVPFSSDYASKRQKILDSLNSMSDDDFLNFSTTQIPIAMTYKKSRRDPYEISFITSSGKRKNIKRISQVSTLARTANADQYWLCNSIKSWVIDTTMTEEIKTVLEEIKDEQNESLTKLDIRRKNLDYIPRLIRDLKIEPNFEDDNYRMTFHYKDTLISLPVIASFGGSINQIQIREKRNYIEYQKKRKDALKEQEIIERYKKDVLVSQIALMKENRATALASQPEWSFTGRERFRFGLRAFGLFNCDRVLRVIPNLIVALSNIGVDRKGKEVAVPDNVRSVLTDDNAYLTTSSDKVPVYEQKQIMFFVLSALEVAVIKGWTTLKNGLKRPEVERISIDGVKPEDVRQRILDAG